MTSRSDDAIAPGVTSLAVGLVSFAPLVASRVVPLYSVPEPVTSLLLLAAVAGLLAAVFGLALLVATLLLVPASALVPRPWGRAVGGLLATGAFGGIASQSLGAPAAPLGFRIVTPYTPSVTPPARWAATGSFAAVALVPLSSE